LFASWETGKVVGDCARFVFTPRVPVSSSYARERVAARQHIQIANDCFGAWIHWRSQRTG